MSLRNGSLLCKTKTQLSPPGFADCSERVKVKNNFDTVICRIIIRIIYVESLNCYIIMHEKTG